MRKRLVRLVLLSVTIAATALHDSGKASSIDGQRAHRAHDCLFVHLCLELWLFGYFAIGRSSRETGISGNLLFFILRAGKLPKTRLAG